MNLNDLLIFGLLGLVLLAGVFLLLQPPASAPQQEVSPGFMQLAQQAGSGEIPDKCKAPPGTDPVKWKEHLGHHPDQYGDCPQ